MVTFARDLLYLVGDDIGHGCAWIQPEVANTPGMFTPLEQFTPERVSPQPAFKS